LKIFIVKSWEKHFFVWQTVDLSAGQSLTETAKQLTQCDGESTGITKPLPMMLEPYVECGGITAGITISKCVSYGTMLTLVGFNGYSSSDAGI